MDRKEVKLVFSNTFDGTLIAPKGEVSIGTTEGKVLPYDMLLGALGSCLYSTFMDGMKKKRIDFERFEMDITGEKRTEIPTTLKWVNVSATVYAPDKENGVSEAFRLATEYCSIYQTLSHVAEMTYEIKIAE